jgi:hypothetical protein
LQAFFISSTDCTFDVPFAISSPHFFIQNSLFIIQYSIDCVDKYIYDILQINIPFIHDPYLNIILRALAVYFFMIIAIRVFGKKELAQLSVIDLVFILLISNAVQNAMVGPDTSLQGGLIAAASLFAANYTLKKLLYRNQKLSSLVQGKAILLIYKGQVNEENCRKAEITPC